MYQITDEQRKEILTLLGEVPLKYSGALFNFFNAMQPIEEKPCDCKPKESETNG